MYLIYKKSTHVPKRLPITRTMAPQHSKVVEADHGDVCRSLRNATTNYPSHHDEAVTITNHPIPAFCVTETNRDQTAAKAHNNNSNNIIPKIGTSATTSTFCSPTTLDGGERSIVSSSSSIISSSISISSSSSKRSHHKRKTTHQRRRQRKRLLSLNRFFVDSHQELLFRFGSSYKEFVIPYPSPPPPPPQGGKASKPYKGQEKSSISDRGRFLPSASHSQSHLSKQGSP